MSQAPEFRDLAKQASIYEVIGRSGKAYVFFFFSDGSVCAARRVAAGGPASARLDFTGVNVKAVLKECGAADIFGTTTYQVGRDLLNKLDGRS